LWWKKCTHHRLIASGKENICSQLFFSYFTIAVFNFSSFRHSDSFHYSFFHSVFYWCREGPGCLSLILNNSWVKAINDLRKIKKKIHQHSYSLVYSHQLLCVCVCDCVCLSKQNKNKETLCTSIRPVLFGLFWENFRKWHSESLSISC
jgi:hypothetical protein